ncbi:unnamed protein product, partial [Ectocarpus sp. 4 AP-2014]
GSNVKKITKGSKSRRKSASSGVSSYSRHGEVQKADAGQPTNAMDTKSLEATRNGKWRKSQQKRKKNIEQDVGELRDLHGGMAGTDRDRKAAAQHVSYLVNTNVELATERRQKKTTHNRRGEESRKKVLHPKKDSEKDCKAAEQRMARDGHSIRNGKQKEGSYERNTYEVNHVVTTNTGRERILVRHARRRTYE